MKTRPFNLLKSLVFTLCIAYPLSACSQSPRDYSGTATVKMYRQNVNDIITLKIPVGYLDHFVLAGPPVPGAPENKSPVRDTMYFEVDLPDLQARSAANNWKFEYPDSLTEKMSFKYHVRYFPPENERYGLWQDTLLSRLGMKHPDCFQRRMPGDRFGMEYHHIDSKTCHADAPSLRDDRFILRDAQGGIKTMLTCLPDDVPDRKVQIATGKLLTYNPRCEHTYLEPFLNAMVTLNYPRHYRESWKSMERRVNEMLKSFGVVPAAPMPSESANPSPVNSPVQKP